MADVVDDLGRVVYTGCMAKNLTTMRLSGEAKALLDKAAADQGVSRTAIMEQVIRTALRPKVSSVAR